MAEITTFRQSDDTGYNAIVIVGVSQTSSTSSADTEKPCNSLDLWDDHDNAEISAGVANSNDPPHSEQHGPLASTASRTINKPNVYQYWKCNQFSLLEVTAKK